MGRVKGTIAASIEGKVGNLVFYKVDGVTYVRSAPGKQSKSTKENVSPLKKMSQDKMSMTQKYLKGLSKVIGFGYQEYKEGARRPYHACVSYTKTHCFSMSGQTFFIDPALFKMSRGSLMPVEDAKADKTDKGIIVSWEDNSWKSSAKPFDRSFLVIHQPDSGKVHWEFEGEYRSAQQHLIPLTITQLEEKWHVYLAFSQSNSRGKTLLSDSIYIGII